MIEMTDECQVSKLIIDIRPGEKLKFQDIQIELVQKSGNLARLAITAPQSVKIEKKKKEFVPSMAN